MSLSKHVRVRKRECVRVCNADMNRRMQKLVNSKWAWQVLSALTLHLGGSPAGTVGNKNCDTLTKEASVDQADGHNDEGKSNFTFLCLTIKKKKKNQKLSVGIHHRKREKKISLFFSRRPNVNFSVQYNTFYLQQFWLCLWWKFASFKHFNALNNNPSWTPDDVATDKGCRSFAKFQ